MVPELLTTSLPLPADDAQTVKVPEFMKLVLPGTQIDKVFLYAGILEDIVAESENHALKI